ncbi:phenylalanine--tRNA ligase subunit alpha [Patescibacteria group bacterium]|nr:phenylalanine--tRNA ligase subunit alpha [Patescibacteria group bacterium]
MDQSLKQFTKTALAKISQVKNNSKLEKLRIQFLGRKGKINQLFSQIKNIPPEKRKEYGQNLNSLKKKLEIAFKKQAKITKTSPLEKISPPKISRSYSLAKIGHLHPISLTERKLNQLFSHLGFSIYDGPEIETDKFCFENLNVPLNHPAREMQDSIYIQEPQVLLRTQTSSIEARLLSLEKPPFKVVFPGRVYRNEKVNKSNHFIFHQYQAVVVGKNINLKDLFGCIDLMFKTLYGPKVVVRYRNKYYPEVEPGVGPDMQCFSCHGHGCPLCKGAGWIEMGGAGIIHPNVLAKAGINPQKWRGFAFGMGLDRWTMANYSIKDIRTLLGGNLAYKPNQI